jgi:hypothetical protein
MVVFKLRLGKHPAEMNTHSTTDCLKQGVFFMWPAPKSYKEEYWGNQSVELCKGG